MKINVLDCLSHTMTTVELHRRVSDVTNAELEAPELLALRNERSFSSGDDWTAILRCPRVVLLAEAGSGKSVEMREQARRLMAEGTPAFFVALESLDKENLTELMSPDESRAFLAWKAQDRSIAFFFLDAVDELKLTHGKFERALARLARETDGLLHRMHVVISSRPSDWRHSIDMGAVWSKLPIPPGREIPPLAPEKAFLAALREQEGRRTAEPLRNDEANKSRTVVLLPLSEKQIEIFAHSRGMSDPAAFIAEIRKRDAWIFARRPLDLVELIDSWMSNGRLGTRAEQHAANLTVKLKDDPERADRGILSDDKARLGAKRLALAIALTRNRTIRSPDQPVEVLGGEGSLNPSEILTDWTEEERQVLLRRPLFDPATYGRVRFHHRSVQEYLAARRLRALRHQGMPAKSLRRLLFTERYGVPVVIPSMQPVTAWLALWDEDVRRELMKREPETLLSMGDPESLPMTARARLLRAFAESYGRGGWRGLSIPVDEIRRLAHPELAEVVRELWGATPTNPDVTELLLEVIRQGPIESCADLAQEATLDTNLSAHHRVTAIRALIACGRSVDTRKIAESLLWEPTKWPEPVVYGVADELFPYILGAAELVSLIERTPEPNRTIGGGFSWKMRQIAERVEPWSAHAVKLRDGLADLIWRNRDKKHQWHCLNGRFKYIAPALARLCDRQLDAGVPPLEHGNDLIWACVVANRFGQDEIGGKDLAKDLREHFAGNPILRETAFWTEAALMAEVAPTTDAWERYYRAEQRSLVGSLNRDDRKWLAGALTNGLDLERRALALQALVGLWIQGGRSEPELDAVRSAVQDDAYLTEELQRRSAPTALNPQYARWQRNERRMNLVAEGRERQRLDGWLRWRTELVADSETAFAPEQLPVTIHNLYAWLQAHSENRNRYNVWDADALREACSISQRARLRHSAPCGVLTRLLYGAKDHLRSETERHKYGPKL
jgi:hypothetical protein